CAAAHACLTAIRAENLVDKAAAQGVYFKEQLEALAAKYADKVKEVRGRGLILGMELVKEGKPVVESCLKEHVIVNCTAGNVIRLVPPLIVTKEEIDKVVQALDKALAEF
ncbi:MAG: aminotransferase class III-fold pyridoxal phosphate-dependent enzyme, partial [Phascolarctobacterium sp.]|nr:aminotransferase class III-fold pyridoxal phosphate-dependent enzyme [Phascolarctobacterium sp.]